MNHDIVPTLIHAARRVEARFEAALAGVGLSNAKFETLTVLVSNGVISGGGASGQVARGGAVKGNANVLGFKFDFVGHFRG